MKFSLRLKPYQDTSWTIAKQLGIENIITKIPQDKNQDSILTNYISLLQFKKSFSDFGLNLIGLEGDQFNMHNIKWGKENRDKDIEKFCNLIKNMGAVGINLFCYNFMADQGELKTKIRTSLTTRLRGGAFTTSFNYDLLKQNNNSPNILLKANDLLDNYYYFLEKVLPVAEKSKVKLALHPDDPPLQSINGIDRIFYNIESFKDVLNKYPSDYNGITLCQGNFAAMEGDLYRAIRYFGKSNKIFYVHFRNIKGEAKEFVETFHDEGKINMFKALRIFREIGYDGPIRPDHTPTMAGEDNNDPGYKTSGRIFAIGYMKGLMEGIKQENNKNI